MSYIAEVHETWNQFMQDLRAGYFDAPEQEDEQEHEDPEVEDERLEQTIRDYNDAICEVGY